LKDDKKDIKDTVSIKDKTGDNSIVFYRYVV